MIIKPEELKIVYEKEADGRIRPVYSIDAVPVVRCKDCMKYDTHGHRCKHWNHGVVVMDFCSRAERRTYE